MSQISKTDLSASKQRLVELMQDINFGRITHLPIVDGEPEFTQRTLVEREIKLSGQNGPRPERDQGDFVLKQEVLSLLEQLAWLVDGVVCLIEIKHGLPFLMRIEERVS